MDADIGSLDGIIVGSTFSMSNTGDAGLYVEAEVGKAFAQGLTTTSHCAKSKS